MLLAADEDGGTTFNGWGNEIHTVAWFPLFFLFFQRGVIVCL